MDFRFTYLYLDCLFLLVWVGLFIWRKDNRREMIALSLLCSLFAIPAEYIHTADWWRPELITGTRVGLEDILYCISIGGIAAVVYEDLFRKHVRIRRHHRPWNVLKLLAIMLIGSVIFFGGYYLLHINSFIAVNSAFIAISLIILIRRPDLITDSLMTGIILLLITIVIYNLVELAFPGWIEAFWLFQNVPHIIVANVPVDDLVWYPLAGMVIGPLYEYWQEGRLVKAK